MAANQELSKQIEEYHANREKLMLQAVSGLAEKADVFLTKSAHQSTLFMVEIIPIIHQLYFNAPENIRKSVLDVGPQTFFGTELLQRLHAEDTFSQLKFEVSAIDIHNKFELLRQIIAPKVRFIKGDIFALKEKFDLIICSHVIEHVKNPEAFIDRLKHLSKDHLIVACPWNENPITTTGHINTIDKAFVRRTGASGLHIYTNFMWGKRREACIFWYSK